MKALFIFYLLRWTFSVFHCFFFRFAVCFNSTILLKYTLGVCLIWRRWDQLLYYRQVSGKRKVHADWLHNSAYPSLNPLTQIFANVNLISLSRRESEMKEIFWWLGKMRCELGTDASSHKRQASKNVSENVSNIFPESETVRRLLKIELLSERQAFLSDQSLKSTLNLSSKDRLQDIRNRSSSRWHRLKAFPTEISRLRLQQKITLVSLSRRQHVIDIEGLQRLLEPFPGCSHPYAKFLSKKTAKSFLLYRWKKNTFPRRRAQTFLSHLFAEAFSIPLGFISDTPRKSYIKSDSFSFSRITFVIIIWVAFSSFFSSRNVGETNVKICGVTELFRKSIWNRIASFHSPQLESDKRLRKRRKFRSIDCQQSLLKRRDLQRLRMFSDSLFVLVYRFGFVKEELDEMKVTTAA